MDAYHKVLVKIYEITGGKDNVDVDFADLLKKEGFFPSIEDIKSYLSSESWIAETSRVNIVRITHWGVAEAKRSLSSGPDPKTVIEKDTRSLVNAAKDLALMAEELSGAPSKDKIKAIESKHTAVGEMIGKVKANL
ncbi:MAG: hypothetical protein KF762_10995 [Acidobacteria bacterium]|mgnify:FL=1|nr:hypothetical protein [Acidobacteriota bacterium]